MIYRRAIAKLRAQDWFAIAVELGIVILGVFIGNWVNDWRQAENQRREVAGLVERLEPALEQLDTQIGEEKIYFATARSYAETALAGWTGDPSVSDSQFVIAAYQASQITGFGADSQTFSSMLGADQVREVPDPALRTAISRVLGAEFSGFYYQSLLTEYRKNVRELIPDPIQQQIRRRCGDRLRPSGALFLPPSCTIDVPPDQMAQAAATIRANPELVKQLRYHLAESATFIGNVSRYDVRVQQLEAMIADKH